MYSYLCLLVLLLPLTTAQAPGDRDPSCPPGGDASTVVIFDSNHYTSLIPSWRSINNGDTAEVSNSQLPVCYSCGVYGQYVKKKKKTLGRLHREDRTV